MNCPNCNHENPAEARFCANCGQPLPQVAQTTAPGLEQQAVSLQTAKRGAGVVRTGRRRVPVVAVVVGTIALLFLLVPVGHSFFGGPPLSAVMLLLFLLLFFGALGACWWVAVTGHWPGARLRVNPILRALLVIIPVVINGLVGAAMGAIFACTGDFVCAGLGPVAGSAIGLGIFIGLAIVQLAVLLLLVALVKLVLRTRPRARLVPSS